MNIYVILTLVSVIFSFALMIVAIVHRAQPVSFYLIFLFGANFMYSFGYLLEITAKQLDAAFLGLRVSYIGLPFLLPLTFLTLRDVYGKKRFTPSVHILIFALPFLSMLSVQMYPVVTIYYRNMEYIYNGWIANCLIYPGVLYHIHFSFIYLMTILSIILIFRRFRLKNQHRRRQSILFLLALSIPVATTIPYVASVYRVRFDFTPMSTVITMALLMYSVLFTNFIWVVPLAREQVLEEMQDAFVICSADSRFLYANQAAVQLFPVLSGLKTGDSPVGLAGLAERQDEVTLAVQGQNRIFKVSYANIQEDRKESGYSVLYHDITQKSEILKKLHFRATMDELTGALNRESFLALNVQLSEDTATACALLMIDLDHFKQINDTRGHAAGDYVLRETANLIRERLPEDASFGRYGGEEWLILFKHLNQSEAMERAQDLRQFIKDHAFDYQGHPLHITISIGVAVSALEESIPFDDLLRRADRAMYIAKEKGRDGVFLYGESL